jgi:uncharacterized cupredoxin-like copper-binding protein
MRQRARLATALVALVLLTVACGGSGGDGGASPTPDQGIATTLTDFAIKTAETEAPAGRVSFDLQNDGPSEHTFFLVKTDLADDALPVVDHVVDLGGLDIVAQTGVLTVGAQPSVTEDLSAGAYVMFCNLPGHYESDMHASFTVT